MEVFTVDVDPLGASTVQNTFLRAQASTCTATTVACSHFTPPCPARSGDTTGGQSTSTPTPAAKLSSEGAAGRSNSSAALGAAARKRSSFWRQSLFYAGRSRRTRCRTVTRAVHQTRKSIKHLVFALLTVRLSSERIQVCFCSGLREIATRPFAVL